MWNKKIGANQINARLGDLSNPRPQQSYTPSPYADDEPAENAAISRHNDYGQERSSDGGVVFYASIIGVFLAVGLGTYLFAGGGLELPSFGSAPAPQVAALTSTVDSTCGKGWRENVPNVDQMHCYMTKNVSRLCNAEEKAHLLATIERYKVGYDVWDSKLMGATIGAVVNTNMNGLRMGYEESQARNEKLTNEQQAEHFGKLMDIAGDNMAGTNDVLSQVKNTIPMYKLTEDFTALASKGLVVPEDFGWSKADFIKKGFASVKAVKPLCPPPLKK